GWRTAGFHQESCQRVVLRRSGGLAPALLGLVVEATRNSMRQGAPWSIGHVAESAAWSTRYASGRIGVSFAAWDRKTHTSCGGYSPGGDTPGSPGAQGLRGVVCPASAGGSPRCEARRGDRACGPAAGVLRRG